MSRQRTRNVIDRAKNLDGDTLKRILGTVWRRATVPVHSFLRHCLAMLSKSIQSELLPGGPRPLSCTTASLMRLVSYLALTLTLGRRAAPQSQLPSWVNFPDFEKVSWVNSVIGATPYHKRIHVMTRFLFAAESIPGLDLCTQKAARLRSGSHSGCVSMTAGSCRVLSRSSGLP